MQCEQGQHHHLACNRSDLNTTGWEEQQCPHARRCGRSQSLNLVLRLWIKPIMSDLSRRPCAAFDSSVAGVQPQTSHNRMNNELHADDRKKTLHSPLMHLSTSTWVLLEAFVQSARANHRIVIGASCVQARGR
jgi:hypothetical protein